MRRRLQRIAIGAVALVVVAVLAVVVLLHTDWGRDWVRRHIVVPALAGMFPGGAKVGRIDGSVFGELVVHDLELDAADGKPQLVVGTTRIRISLLPLLGHTARIDRLVVEDVVATVREQPAATTSPEPAAASAPSPWSVELSDLAVHRGRVVIESAKGTNEIRDLEATAFVALAGNGGGLTAMGDVQARWRDAPIDVGVTLYQHADLLTVPAAHVTVAEAHATAIGLRLQGTSLAGTLAARLPALTAHDLAGVELPGDVVVELDALPTGEADVRAAVIGDEPFAVRAIVRTDVAHRAVRGLAFVEDADLATVTRGALTGRGAVAVAFDAGLDHAQGMAAAEVTLGPKSTASRASLAFAIDRRGGEVLAAVSGVGTRAALSAQLARKGDRMTLAKSTLDVRIRDASALVRETNRPIPLSGAFSARLHATGVLAPDPDLDITGSVNGTSVRFGDLGAEAFQIRIDEARGLPAHAEASGRLAIAGVDNAGAPVGSASVAVRAGLRKDGAIVIDLGKHQVSTASGAVWEGTGGRVIVTPDRIDLRALQTGMGGAAVTASGSVARASGDLSATLEARDVPLVALAPPATGTAAGTATVSRKGGRWSGNGSLHARHVVVAAGRPAIDGDLDVAIAGRRLTLRGTATAEPGAVSVALDVDGPRELTDAAAWRKLDRRAVRDLSIHVGHLDASRLGGSGVVDGELGISASHATGTLHIRELAGPRGTVGSADLSLAPDGADLAATLAAHLEGIGDAEGRAQLALPAHLFDPDAWRALGRDVLRGATVEIRDLAIDPQVLARLGANGPWHARMNVHADVERGAVGATVSADVRALEGGPIVRPLDVHVQGTLDRAGAKASLVVGTGATRLLEASAQSPLTPERLATARLAPVIATIAIPTLAVRDAFAVVGRSGALGGTLGGTISIGGTIGTPTAQAELKATDLSVPASIAGRPPATLKQLALSARWGGVAGELELTGTEESGATLRLAASGQPTDPSTLRAAIDAKHLDIAPFAQFAPGPLGGATGVLDAALELHGLDPSGDVRGELHLHDGRLPIASVVGTLRKAELAVKVADHRVTADLTGKLGRGDITANSTLVLDGASPRTFDAKLAVKQISLIRALQPVLDANVTAHLARDGRHWSGDVKIRDGHVVIPTHSGSGLLEAGAPSDMTFVDAPPPPASILKRPPPSDPWLIAKVDLGSTTLEDVELQVRAAASGKLTVSLGGDSIGIDGAIDADRGDLDFAGRLYQVDHGSLVFDGTLDPMLNFRILHDFPDLTLTADVGGRVSDPDLNFSSDPSGYTQSQLLGFFLGGEPGGDPNGQAQQAAAGLASAWFNTTFGRKLNQAIGLRLSYNYEAETATNSQAVRVGLWVTKHMFIAYRQHVDARPDENANEGEAEYHLPWGMLLQGNYGDRGYSGGDMVLLHLRW